jgi:lipid-A-disaccharide synthase
MANLIAGKRVVPELIQHDFTAAKIAEEMERLLPDGVARESMMKELGTIRDALSWRPGEDLAKGLGATGGAIERVAAITLEELEASSPKAVEFAVQS